MHVFGRELFIFKKAIIDFREIPNVENSIKFFIINNSKIDFSSILFTFLYIAKHIFSTAIS